MDKRIDKTALSYWFPIVREVGVPVPETILLEMPVIAQKAIWAAFDGKEDGDPHAFFADLRQAAKQVGYPCFLRTDYTSGKHDWARTCCVADEESLPQHVFAIAEFSEIAGMFGELPWTRWAVREMLPTRPIGHCPYYGDMPICREFRLFVEDGDVRCVHPYWPMNALKDGGAEVSEDAFARLCDPGHDLPKLDAIASMAGRALGGAWSVDILDTERGWFLTDMAEAHKSFHWDGCENQ